MSSFTINPATEPDVLLFLCMIRELAEFENLAHELEVTAGSLRKALFGPQPAAAALLARAGNKPAGYAIYYTTFSSFAGRPGVFLEDLYVRPPYRRQGLGRALLQRVASIAAERDGRFEWTTLRWNSNALQFYHRLGARIMGDWSLLRISGQPLQALAGDPVAQNVVA